MSAPSSNWLALRKVIAPSSSRKRKRALGSGPTATERGEPPGPSSATPATDFVRGHSRPTAAAPNSTNDESLPGGAFAGEFGKAALAALREVRPSKGSSLPEMRALVLGTAPSPSSGQAGKYVALDCEMVGVGPDGAESALARVSAVDFHGAVLLDVFVKQREHVADWRTHVSGVRESDMKHAKPFDDVQKEVAKLLEGRVLVGHALSNDMQALLLSHPRPQTRDTQAYCGKLKLAGSRPSLRNLAKLHFGLDIQAGEHSSVTDARAAMAIYRVHSKAWEQLAKGHTPTGPTAADATTALELTATTVTTTESAPSPPATKKRKRDDSTVAAPKDGIVLHLAGSEDEGDAQRVAKRAKPAPALKASAGKPLKAKIKAKTKTTTKTRISSGLSTVVRGGSTGDKRSVTAGQASSSGKKSPGGGGEKWWETLGGAAKGSVRVPNTM